VNGCISNPASFTINDVPPAPVISLVSSQNNTCFGISDGSIEIGINGGQAPYDVSWTPSSATGTSLSSLPAGTYTVTVLDDLGCSTTASYTVTEPEQLLVTGTSQNVICGQSLGQISTNVDGGQAPYTFTWNPGGANSPTLGGLASGIYSVTVEDQNGCTVSASFTVGLTGSLDITTTQSATEIDEGESVDLSASGASSYVWVPSSGLSCNDCASPIATPDQTTTYLVTGSDQYGCTGTTALTIFVIQNCDDFFIPNIFSPNNTGPEANNTYCVAGSCFLEFSLQIFNRWGEKVFESFDQNTCWDGKWRGEPVGTGVFAYKFYATKQNGEIIDLSGSLTVVY